MTDGQATSLFSSDRLLGLDEIESGFDVMSMVSLAESESRFRIFDLSDTGPNEFRVSVLGQQRMFNIPLNVQVTNINTRRVINCEDLSNGFTCVVLHDHRKDCEPSWCLTSNRGGH
ncbi:unnamed protein product [Rotaria magnacalcarata]|uniref:Uncharacterized protein n=1 Tax=Rotaria magnacalcarata TaxID=392030 RepID=A0A815U7W8_9BILA|nr:unnamed protein product [Rotaria magnacalcarata]CAF4968840.1 unnamed protein product [Rotaria magnacalcarata]